MKIINYILRALKIYVKIIKNENNGSNTLFIHSFLY